MSARRGSSGRDASSSHTPPRAVVSRRRKANGDGDSSGAKVRRHPASARHRSCVRPLKRGGEQRRAAPPQRCACRAGYPSAASRRRCVRVADAATGRDGGRGATALPSWNTISPEVGLRSPQRRRASVVLPTPFAPTTAVIEPQGISVEKSRYSHFVFFTVDLFLSFGRPTRLVGDSRPPNPGDGRLIVQASFPFPKGATF